MPRMNLARVYSRAGVGVTAPLVKVEVHSGGGLSKMSLVGLPETAVREAKDRVRAALYSCGFDFPPGHITISLAPADLPKEGGRFDLAIALGILAASAQLDDSRLDATEFIGELSLGGELHPVPGVLPVAIATRAAGRQLVVPSANGAEAALARGGRPLAADSLPSVVGWLHGLNELPPARTADPAEPPSADPSVNGNRVPDLADVRGQHVARRALEISAAGAHNLLLYGPPGTGKTMLASRLPGILPPLTEAEALASAAVASISQAGLDLANWRVRSFRAPHHTASSTALVGGGSKPRPGEISLAHHGVLFLDELPEFNRNVLEVLREPLESGRIVISRAAGRAEFPARFQLVATMNPCPCGHHGDRQKPCICSADQISRYRGKVSGPLLDRIDLFVEVPRPQQVVIPGKGEPGEASVEVRKRVVAARRIQVERQGVTNERLDTCGVKDHCRLRAGDEAFFEQAAEQLSLSPRGCQRVLKVARTIADLDCEAEIGQAQLAEAIGFRQPGRG